jgi:hypothetical protein
MSEDTKIAGPQASAPFTQSETFNGFRTPVSATIANLIFQHVGDTSLLENIWLTMSLQMPIPGPPPSTKILTRTFFVVVPLMTELRLVNRAWNILIIPVLYRAIYLSSPDQAIALLTTLRQNPERRILVKTITIATPPFVNVRDHEAHPNRRTLRNLFRRNLPALKQLYTYTTSFMDIMTYLKDSLRGKISLTHLCIRCHGPCVSMSTAYIWSILREFPELEEFWFEFHGDGVKCENARELPRRLMLPSMRKLGIVGAVVDDDTVEELCCISPKLEELEIDRENRFCII